MSRSFHRLFFPLPSVCHSNTQHWKRRIWMCPTLHNPTHSLFLTFLNQMLSKPSKATSVARNPRLHWFASLPSLIGFKTRATHPTNQSDVKLKPVAPWALGSLLNSTLSRLSLAPFYFIFLLIDLCDWSLWFWFYDPSSCNIKKKFISIFSCVLHLKVAVARREEIIKKQDEAIRSLEVINQLVLRSEQLFSLPITGAIQLETSGPKYFRTEHNFITEGKST